MSDNPNLETKLQLGITAAKRGDKEGAQVLLKQVLAEDKKSDRAWLWLAVVAPDKATKKRYLQTALQHNPQNAHARKALRKMSSKRSKREQRTLLAGTVMLLAILVISTLMCLLVLAAQ